MTVTAGRNAAVSRKKIVFTIGIRENEQDFVREYFACGGQVIDVDRQYQDIVSAPYGDRIVIMNDRECFSYSRSAWDELFGTYQKERALMQEWKDQWKQTGWMGTYLHFFIPEEAERIIVHGIMWPGGPR